MSKYFYLLFCINFCAIFAANPWEPESRDGPGHNMILNLTKERGHEIQIVFYGDEIVQNWTRNGKEVWDQHYVALHAANYGLIEDKTQQLVWRIQHRELDGLRPKILILHIGTNNLGLHSDEDIAKGVKTVTDLIRVKLAYTKILVLGILPRGIPHSKYQDNVRHINSMVSAIDNGDSIRFLDMFTVFANSFGDVHSELFTDGIHLSKDGYNVWAITMDPLLKQMLEVASNDTIHPTPSTKLPRPWEMLNRDGHGHHAFVEYTKFHGNTIRVLFLGDDIIQEWTGIGKGIWDQHYVHVNGINYGLSGDLTQHLLWRIQNGEINGDMQPKVVVLLIGTNNLGTDTDENIAKGIKAIVDLLHGRLPLTKILLLGILPRGFTHSYVAGNIRHINSIISSYDNGNYTRFLDMGLHFVDSAGHVKPGLLEKGYLLSRAGYGVWAEIMDPLLKEMLI